MIDKVELRNYDPSTYRIISTNNFTRPLHSMGKNWSIYNNSKNLQSYYPHLVIDRYPNPKGTSYTIQALEVDCSLPKLLYGNNLYELQDKDFAAVCNTLAHKLGIMGLTITPQVIANMEVKSVEYGKNILTRNIPVSYILQELYRAKPLNNFMDVQRSTFRNDGEALTFYCSGYEIVFYDKTLEVLQELSQNPRILPTNLVCVLQNGTTNILRMEVRFHDRPTLKDFLITTHQLTTGTLLRNVYSVDISKHVLNYYWNNLSTSARLVSPFVLSPAFELWQIHKHSRGKTSTQKKLAKLGLRYLIREHGYSGAKSALKCVGCSNPATYIQQYTNTVFRPLQKLDIWRFIDGALSRFSCLNVRRWQNFKNQTRGAWFYKKEPLLTTKETSGWLNVAKETVRQEVRKGKIWAKKIGRQWRINRYDVLEYLYKGV